MSAGGSDHAASSQNGSNDESNISRTDIDLNSQEDTEFISECESDEFVPWSLSNVRSGREKLKKREYNRRNLVSRCATPGLFSQS